jgi:hypothetical protein
MKSSVTLCTENVKLSVIKKAPASLRLPKPCVISKTNSYILVLRHTAGHSAAHGWHGAFLFWKVGDKHFGCQQQACD